jgi:hypothetical protein
MAEVSIKPRVSDSGERYWVGSIEGLEFEYSGESPEEVAKTLVEDVDLILEILRATVAPNIDLAGRIVEAFAEHVGESLNGCIPNPAPESETLKIPS